MTKNPVYIVTLQKHVNGAFQEFLYMEPLMEAPVGWDKGVTQYAQEHYPARVTRNSSPLWDVALGQYTRTWAMATSWGVPTTLRLVARLWPAVVL